ncbi:MAG: DUF6089 family protein [Flavobacteriales bacterium]|nr:MAG: DUF6089 family protein [Flavobacteriales bacterium]
MQRTLLRYVLSSVTAILLAGAASGQYFRQSTYWKTHRQEVEFGFGIANFLGELGGRNQIGSPFVWDLEISQTRPAASLAYRYYLARQQALRMRFTYGVLAGNDNLTTEPFRQNRNLSFKSDVFELSLVYELHLYREELGHIYDLRGVKGTKSSRVGLYFFAGVGGFYFDPRAQFNNAWVRLKPLGTEGQGLPNGAEEYNNYQICIPMGVGIRRAFTKQWSAGLELQYTKTFTDYIDDVSTNYYDNAAIREARGDVAAYLANPGLNTPYMQEQGINPTATGQQRGDEKDLDAYLFLKFTADWKMYKYKSGSKKYRARIRRAKIVF